MLEQCVSYAEIGSLFETYVICSVSHDTHDTTILYPKFSSVVSQVFPLKLRVYYKTSYALSTANR